jgi:isopenicillin N synthase-like dioxygenase
MNSFSYVHNFRSIQLGEYFSYFAKNSTPRIVSIAIALIGLFGITYIALRFINFKATTSKNEPEEAVEPISNKDHASFDDSLKNLKEGYAIIPLLNAEVVQNLFADLKRFDAQSESYKQQFMVKDQVEVGYAVLKNKKVFVVRNQHVPDELKHSLSYIPFVHALAIDILHSIEKDLDLENGQLTDTVSHTPLPVTDQSTSLLRLFAYDPSNETGESADAHEDLGLLTIIPCSQVPALEVVNYKEDCQWINVESLADASHAIVLAGKTLEQMTNGRYLAGTHRVKKSPEKRFSIVYQLRAEPDTQISTKDGTITVEEWLKNLKKNLRSVNGSY